MWRRDWRLLPIGLLIGVPVGAVMVLTAVVATVLRVSDIAIWFGRRAATLLGAEDPDSFPGRVPTRLRW
jgi:hypothetical protein